MKLDLIMYIIAAEAVVRLWFYAAPLQAFRWWLILHTPIFSVSPSTYTTGGHVFECKYCTSVWVAFLFCIFYFFFHGIIVDFIVTMLVIHRGANIIHSSVQLLEEHIRQFHFERALKNRPPPQRDYSNDPFVR